MTEPHLKRRIGLGLLTLYGIGTMVGAGIYVLIGPVAGSAGVWAPLAFLLAGLVALPAALSYAELSARIPEAAGEAAYIEAGFGWRWLAVLVGLALVFSAIVSAAAVLRGGVGYLTEITAVDPRLAIIVIGAALTLIALVGVLESLSFAGIITLIEVGGLLLVVWAGFNAAPVADWTSPPDIGWGGIAGAVILCFFAFLGFEDIVNMAEEVRDPERTLPRGLLLSLLVTALLYALVSLAAVRAVPTGVLAQSDGPLALVWKAGFGGSGAVLTAVAVAAALNGVLVQIVMAARVLFGLGRRVWFLAPFTQTHPRFATPARATLLLGIAVVAGALFLPVESLARIASSVLLVIFALVNIALFLLQRKSPQAPFRVPAWVPVSGAVFALVTLVMTYGGMS